MNRYPDYFNITSLDDTGLVKTVYSSVNRNAWKYGKQGAYDNCCNLAENLRISTENMVMLNQTHTSKVRVVTKEDGGEMVSRPMSVEGYDGMITNERGLLLATTEADCVPVYFLDPVKKVIGMVHSGWRGTAGCICVDAVKKMTDRFGSSTGDIKVVIGPCICRNCYEVGEELLKEFLINYSSEETELFFVFKRMENGIRKYSLDLKEAIFLSLERAGIPVGNMSAVGKCTFETEYLGSWRRDNPNMRSMITGIMLV